jgi:hypothetical protein
VELYGQNSFATDGYIPWLEEASWDQAIFRPGGTVEVRAEVSDEMLVVHVLSQVVGAIFAPVGLLFDLATVTELSAITADMEHFKAAMREFDALTTMSGGSPAEFARLLVLSLQTEQARWGQIFTVYGKAFVDIPKLVLDVLLVPFDDMYRNISEFFGAQSIDEDVVRFEVDEFSMMEKPVRSRS